MSQRSAAASPATASGELVADGRESRASWVGAVVLLDFVAGFLCFVAAGGYLILKVLNDRQSALARVLDELAYWFFVFGIDRLPGLPEYPALRTFGTPTFANVYLMTMAAVHLVASGGFLALAFALAGFRAWARRAHLFLAGLAILILAAYGYFTATSPAPRIALAVMAAGAIVPSAVLAILLTPGIAPLFAEGPRPAGEAITPVDLRKIRLPRLLLVSLLALFVLGTLATLAVISVPVAIDLGQALAPTE